MINEIANVQALCSKHTHISIVTHINPDADTLGTGLGIYNLLKAHKTVEIINTSDFLPQYLDFLPSFSKIKKKMDFTDGLIIACDCGNIKRFGVCLDGRDILNIDHHASNDMFGDINLVKAHYASASQVAYTFFKEFFPIDVDVATCFYTALLSDTRYFTTKPTDKKVFEMAKELVDIGVKPADVAYHFTQRRSLASLRILQKALGSLTLYSNAKIAVMFVTQEDIAQTGASMPEIDGLVDYARSLTTVEIGIFIIEVGEGVRVSLRSKDANVSKLALAFGGGGHTVASGFTHASSKIEEIKGKIIDKIHELGLIDGK